MIGLLNLTPLGRAPGRESGEQITVFESVGVAVQDLAAETGAGTSVDY